MATKKKSRKIANPKLGKAVVLNRVRTALDRFDAEDAYLLNEDVSERTMCASLSCHLRKSFPGWHVDVEYNRDGTISKFAGGGGKTKKTLVVPDIIVHRRGTGPNLLVIEAKGGPATVVDPHDQKKLLAYRKNQGYRFALFLAFRAQGSSERFLKWFD